MSLSAIKTAFLALLLLVPTASRARASGDPPSPRAKKEDVVVEEPEREIVVEGDRVYVRDDGGEDGELLADVSDADDDEDRPMAMRFHGHPGGGYIGIRPMEMTPELRQHLGAPKEAGVLVGTVAPDSPAAKAGLRVGDVVTSVDGEKIDSTRDLVREVRHKKAGDTIKLEVTRERASRTLTLTLAERKGGDDEFRIGELRDLPRFHWKQFGRDPHMPPLPDFGGLEERLRDLEKRLKELESRLPTR